MATALRTRTRQLSNRIHPARLPHLCVAIQAATAEEMLSRAEHAVRDASLLELRLDGLKNPAAIMDGLRDFHRSYPSVNVIATCRKVNYGGKFRGSVEAEWEVLQLAVEAGCSLVDISVQSAERLNSGKLEKLRQRACVIVSWHDFKATPELEPVLARMRRIPADIYKLVPTATRFVDNLAVLNLLERESGDASLVAFAMGEAGLVSRVLSVRAGAAFTFAAPGDGEETAPGQLSLDEMRHVYRADELGRATRLYGVLGNPLRHSLSPRMQNAAFRRAGVNAVYLPVLAKRPEDVLNHLDEIPFSGLSVTIPHKTAVLPLLDGVDPLAKKVGAVNTIVRSQGKLYGYNTDVVGVVKPLEALLPLKGAKVLLLGAGGAARAAAFGLRAAGASVSLCNRTKARGEELAAKAKAKLVKRADLRKLSFDIIVNATPVGQYPHVEEAPLTVAELNARVLFDLVYNPLETRLVRMAREKGLKVIPGVEMFVQQGVRQFEIWTGTPAPVDEMRRAVLAALNTE